MPFDTLLTIFVLLAGGYLAWSIGANDVANAMGTSVGSGAMTLRQAVYAAAVFEFAGAFFFGANVSETMQSGIVNTEIFGNNYLVLVCGMLSALLAAGAWLQFASYYGWPVSTTHSIVGAIVGFGIIAGGIGGVDWENLGFITLSWITSPLLGGTLSFFTFNFLRKRIFFSQEPLSAIKRMFPWLAGLMASTVSAITLLKGSSHTAGFPLALLSTVAFGGGTALLARLWISNQLVATPKVSSTHYAPEIALELDKAAKHLERIAQTPAVNEEMHRRTTSVLNEIQALASSMKKAPVSTSSQYSHVEKVFGYLQVMSACLMAFAHGTNDVSNAIGPLVAALSALKTQEIVASAPIPSWALALGGCGIVIGLATWGWRVIETIGKKITELTPSRGFVAEFSAAATILVASRLGLPVSTTHTLVGAVLGVGLARGLEALDMSTIRHIAMSWLITIPAGALISMLLFTTLTHLFGI